MEQERKNCWKNCRKFLRFLIFSILFICLIYAGYTFTYKFFVEKPTYTSTRIVPQHDAKFPALSICPTPKGYKDGFLKVSKLEKINALRMVGHLWLSVDLIKIIIFCLNFLEKWHIRWKLLLQSSKMPKWEARLDWKQFKPQSKGNVFKINHESQRSFKWSPCTIFVRTWEVQQHKENKWRRIENVEKIPPSSIWLLFYLLPRWIIQKGGNLLYKDWYVS